MSPDRPNFKQQLAASFTGATVTALTMTPLDVIKVRLQVQQKKIPLIKGSSFSCFNGLMECQCLIENGIKVNESPTEYWKRCWYKTKPELQPYKNGFHAFRQIIKHEGVSRLWSGTTATITQSSLSVCFYFTFYEYLRDSFKNLNYFKHNQSAFDYGAVPLAGMIARLVNVAIFNPLEVVRIKMQADKTKTYSQHMISLFKNGGTEKPWTKGLKFTLYRDLPFSGVYWTLRGFS